MKNRFSYILSFFLILSLSGLGQNIFINYSNVKNIKESEWVTKINPNGKVSKCYHYNQNSNVTVANLILHSWSNEFTILYDEKVNIKLLSQAKVFLNINPINLILNKIFIPRNSIDDLHNSRKGTDLSMQYCLSSLIRLDVGNINCNYLLKGKWLHQGINTLGILMELNELQNGYSV